MKCPNCQHEEVEDAYIRLFRSPPRHVLRTRFLHF